MKTVKLLLMGLLVATGFVLSPSLHAQMSTSGLYVGGGLGQSNAKNACDPVSGVTVTSCDDKDTAWRIFGGYQFHKNFGVELGYADLGKVVEASGVVLGVPFTAEAKAKAWDLVAVGIWPFAVEWFSLFGKAGIVRWDVDVSATGTVPGFAPISASASDNGTDFTYGAGAQFNFTKNVGARVEWQRYNDVGDVNTTGQSDVDVISASVLFMF